MSDTGDGPQYLKQISRIKHHILASYFAPWAVILGSAHRKTGYIDCFAGGGVYVDEEGNLLPGSPLICLQLAKSYVTKYPQRSLILGFSEKNSRTAERLRELLSTVTDLPGAVTYYVLEESAQDFVERIIASVTSGGVGRRIIPTFFFIDPFGHPVTIPVMRRLLALGQTELLVNMMWFRINMDLFNPLVQRNVDKLFGHVNWRTQAFMTMHGVDREKGFLDYFRAEMGARYSIPFRFPFSPEDQVPGGENRTKFYLIHFSSHPKAALLMKQVMWSANEQVQALWRPTSDKPVQLIPIRCDQAAIGDEAVGSASKAS